MLLQPAEVILWLEVLQEIAAYKDASKLPSSTTCFHGIFGAGGSLLPARSMYLARIRKKLNNFSYQVIHIHVYKMISCEIPCYNTHKYIIYNVLKYRKMIQMIQTGLEQIIKYHRIYSSHITSAYKILHCLVRTTSYGRYPILFSLHHRIIFEHCFLLT